MTQPGPSGIFTMSLSSCQISCLLRISAVFFFSALKKHMWLLALANMSNMTVHRRKHSYKSIQWKAPGPQTLQGGQGLTRCLVAAVLDGTAAESCRSHGESQWTGVFCDVPMKPPSSVDFQLGSQSSWEERRRIGAMKSPPPFLERELYRKGR